MTRKILQVGSSAAVTLSKAALDLLGLKIGDAVEVEIDKKSRSIRIQSPDTLSEDDKDVLDIAQGFMKRYRKDLDELARL